MPIAYLPAALAVRGALTPSEIAEDDPLHGRSTARPAGTGPTSRTRGIRGTMGAMLPRMRIADTRTTSPDDFPGRIVSASAFGVSASVALYTKRNDEMRPAAEVRAAGGSAKGWAIGHDLHAEVANLRTGAVVWQATRRRLGDSHIHTTDPNHRLNRRPTESSVEEPGQV